MKILPTTIITIMLVATILTGNAITNLPIQNCSYNICSPHEQFPNLPVDSNDGGGI